MKTGKIELAVPPQTAKPSPLFKELMHTSVIVSALGYFVDIYDLVLFSIVRKPSLESLGVTGPQLLDDGVFLINMQMGGMLLGGLLWGILGDKRGRISVLFGSILLYSIANILNAFVTDVQTYAILRFIAGVGLAGELGAAVTLVSESLSKENRGYATALIAGVGVSGAIAAGLVAKYLDWQAAYIIGGLLGLALLGLRIKMFESPMFRQMDKGNARIRRGQFLMLWTNASRCSRYLASILIGLPIWFVVGVLVTFAPEITQQLGATGPVSAANGIMWAYGGLVLGDLGSGFLSQLLRSRKKVVFGFLMALTLLMLTYLNSYGQSPAYYYGLCFLLGIAAGYWAVFVTVAAEQFGTNLRATVATTVPNFVRGLLVPMTLAFQSLQVSLGLKTSALTVGLVAVGIAFFAAFTLEETYGKDLNFMEGDGFS
jgi:putative MFS transporter